MITPPAPPRKCVNVDMYGTCALYGSKHASYALAARVQLNDNTCWSHLLLQVDDGNAGVAAVRMGTSRRGDGVL